MSDKDAYSLADAAARTPFSVKHLRRAIASTGAEGEPPPLTAKRTGKAKNAPYFVLAADLRDWLAAHEDA